MAVRGFYTWNNKVKDLVKEGNFSKILVWLEALLQRMSE